MEECGGGASREAQPRWTRGFRDRQRNRRMRKDGGRHFESQVSRQYRTPPGGQKENDKSNLALGPTRPRRAEAGGDGAKPHRGQQLR